MTVAKVYKLGTHRSATPGQTLERIGPLLEDAGVTRLADATGLDRLGIPVIFAIRPNSAALAIEGGKGLDLTSATVSAAMEAIERSVADRAAPETFWASHSDLAGAGATATAEQLLLQRSSLFRTDHVDEWVWTEPLGGGDPLAMPACMVGLQPDRRGEEWLHHQTGTNGLASGNDLTEAVLSGLYEVIERDAVACWTQAVSSGARSWSGMALETMRDPAVRELVERFHAAGLEVVVADATHDTGVPTYIAWSWEAAQRQVGVCRGYGAHLDPAVALARALAEVAQARLSLIAGARDDRFLSEWRNARRSDSEARLARLRSQVPQRCADEQPDLSGETFEGDLAIVLERLASVGLGRAGVLDLSPRGAPVAVVRVWVPGLEGYATSYRWPGYRARRFASGVEGSEKA